MESGELKFSDDLLVSIQRNETARRVRIKLSSATDATALAKALMLNRTIDALDLSENEIGPEEIKALCDALKGNVVLKTVNLASNQIGDAGAKFLAELIRKGGVITTLNLRENRIYGAGAKVLVESLMTNETLTHLDLQGNKIGVDGGRHIGDLLKKNITLRHLNLQGNNLGADGARALADALTNNRKIEFLDLQLNHVGPEGAVRLAASLRKHTAIQVLNLQGNELGTEGAVAMSDALATHPTLLSLNVGRNGIGVEGARAFAQLLQKNTVLRELHVQWNNFGVEGAKLFCEACETNTALRLLNMHGNAIGDEGARLVSELLTKNTTLDTVDLQRNEIGVIGGNALAQALMNTCCITALDLGYNRLGPDGARQLPAALRTNTVLKSLNIRDNGLGDSLMPPIADMLRYNGTLTNLNLMGNDISYQGLQHLHSALLNNATLEVFSLSRNGIGDPRAMDVIELCEARCEQTKQACRLARLRGRSKVASFATINSPVNGTRLRTASSTAPTSRRDSFISGQTPLSVQVMTPLRQALVQAPLAPQSPRRQSLAAITPSSPLSSGDSPTRELESDAMSVISTESPRLTRANSTADFGEAQLGYDEVKYSDELLQSLQQNRTPLHMRVRLNASEDIIALAQALAANRSLEGLDISGMRIGDEGARVISDALCHNGTLQILDLRRNHIHAEGAKLLTEALSRNKMLSMLILHGNGIGDEGAALLAEELLTNKTLQSLNIRHNRIEVEGIKKLSMCLKTNKSLRELVLHNNRMGDEGAKAIAEAIRYNASLTTLNIRENGITDAGARELESAMRNNTTITELNWELNPMRDQKLLQSIDLSVARNQQMAEAARMAKEMRARAHTALLEDTQLDALLPVAESLAELAALIKESVGSMSDVGAADVLVKLMQGIAESDSRDKDDEEAKLKVPEAPRQDLEHEMDHLLAEVRSAATAGDEARVLQACAARDTARDHVEKTRLQEVVVYRNAAELYEMKHQEVSAQHVELLAALAPLKVSVDIDEGEANAAVLQYEAWRRESGVAVRRFVELAQAVNRLGREVVESIASSAPVVRDVVAAAHRAEKQIDLEEQRLLPIQAQISEYESICSNMVKRHTNAKKEQEEIRTLLSKQQQLLKQLSASSYLLLQDPEVLMGIQKEFKSNEARLKDLASGMHPELLLASPAVSQMRPFGTDIVCHLAGRKQLVSELLAAEQVFNRNLRVFMEVLVKPVRNSAIFTETRLNQIFRSELDAMLEFSNAALACLTSVVETDPMLQFTSVFIRSVLVFKQFASYCDHLQETCDVYAQSKTIAQFAPFLEAVKHKLDHHVTVESVLESPRQHVAVYGALLTKIYEQTPAVHPDFATMAVLANVATQTAEYVAAQTPEEKSKRDSFVAVALSLDGFPAELFVPQSRSLIHKGLLLRGSTEPRCFAYLCNDMTILATELAHAAHALPAEADFSYSTYYPIDNVTVQGTSPTTFQVYAHETTHRYTVQSMQECDQWLAAFETRAQMQLAVANAKRASQSDDAVAADAEAETAQ
eukprot:TRINITY_DN12027_c0_g1_i1.p1 TRINITY_DN12027_c0_g1~~TRINITY_DN12027_c0_g1_i1.p1  ORF type:complete len:1528 (-),score=408.62 TRINITY_DN12027_c0_g1_i1:189-4772(-)